MRLDVGQISSGLALKDDGIWYARSAAEVSYPEDGGRMCSQVEDRSFWFEHRNRCIVEAVRRYPPDGPIFDVGGGNGYVAAGLIQSGFDAALVEPGAYGSNTARTSRGIPTVICASLENAHFLPHSLPAAGLFDVLEHVADDRGFLRTLSGLLRPSGRLYLTVPAYPLLWSDVDRAAGHYRRYSLGALSRRLGDAGLEIDYRTYFFRFLPVPVLLLRALPSLLGVRSRRTAGRMKRRHLTDSPFLKRWVRRLLAHEVESVRQGRRMPFGGSCLVVASSRDRKPAR